MMKETINTKYKIGNLYFDMEINSNNLLSQFEQFISMKQNVNSVKLTYDRQSIDELLTIYGCLNIEKCENIALARNFYKTVLFHDAVMLHASVIKYKDEALIFCGKSGAGKTTFAHMWEKFFKNEASIFCDDKPLIQKSENIPYVWSTPWCKVKPDNIGLSLPVKAIAVLKKSPQNIVTELSFDEFVDEILKCCPCNDKKINSLVRQQIHKIFGDTSFWQIEATESVDAAKVFESCIYKKVTESGMIQSL